MNIMKRMLSCFLLVMACQQTALADGLYLNNLGSKASAMGGAFVGLADDFSALYWNPAGIARFERRSFGFYGGDLVPRGSYRRDLYSPEIGNIVLIDAETRSKHYFSGLAAYYHPLGDRWVAGIGVYTPCHFGMSWKGVDLAPIADDNPSINWMSKIWMTTISPVVAYKMSRSILIGVSININHSKFDLGRYAGTFNFPLPDPPYLLPIDLGQYSESMSGWGYGATFGLLIRPNGMFSMGATLRTASTIKYRGEARISGFPELGAAFSRDLKNVSETEKKITWPLWLAMGGAFRPNQNLTLTADLQWTRWSTWDIIKMKYQDPLWQSYMSERGNDTTVISWDNTLQVRFGAEYHLSEAIIMRGGFSFAFSPAWEKKRHILLPGYDFHVMTIGVGYHFKDIQIDFGLEYATVGKSEQRTYVYPPAPSSIWESWNPGAYGMKMVAPNVSLGYRF